MKRIPAAAVCFPATTATLCALLLAAGPESQAATVVWSGASGTGTNWSTAANWTGGLPGASDDVKFFNNGANATVSNLNNVVDGGAFGGTIASLQFGNTNNFHTMLIPAGQSLTIAGPLQVGTGTDQSSSQSVFATVTGAGSLSVNNTAANILIGQGNTAASSPTLKATLDLRGLDNFTANVNRLGIGGRSTFTPTPPDRQSGAFYLARTNVITTAHVPASYTTYPVAFPIVLHDNEGNTAGNLSQLFLGQTNAIFTDGIAVGTMKCGGGSNPTAGGWLGFDPAVTNNNPVAYVRGAAGGASRVTRWNSGDGNASGNSSNGSVGTNDFSNGTLDARVDTMVLGKDRGATTSKTFPFRGVFTFTAGTLDVNQLILGNQIIAAAANPCQGFMNVRGSATLVVNGTLELGHTAGSSNATFGQNAATNTTGQLNIIGGTVRASNIVSGTLSATNLITVDGGTLAVSNSISYPGAANLNLALTNATLELIVIANQTNVLIKDLVTGGAGNTINITAAPNYASYPVRIPLIRYAGALGGAGYNFTLGSVPANVSGHLEHNTLGASIDLVLDTAPFPVVTDEPDSVAIAPGQDATFTVAASGVAPFSFTWRRDGTNIVEGGNVWGTSTATLSITNAIVADSGNYDVVIANSYGSTTSAVAVLVVSSTPVAPTINGPANQTVIQGNNATFTASVAGLPIPAIQWRKNGVDISGATGTSLTITNAQYPADNTTYSIVATNSAGGVTNSATLTVTVPPVITTQPTNLTVLNGAAAAFTVAVTGVPAPGYQWKKGGVDISGANSATLSFASVTPADAGTYSVLVTNAAGTVLSSNAVLLVNSAMQATNLFPANGATGVCVDSPLRIHFDQTAVLGNAGRIRIYNVTDTVTPVDTIDLASASQTKTIGGSGYNYRPVLIEGNIAYISPHVALQYGQTYYVTVESVVGGAFKDTLGLVFSGITTPSAWQFSTKAAAPTAGTTNLVVAADNSADFATVQGAIDFVPANNTTPTTINIRNGKYREIVFVNQKNNLLFKGENRQQTIITYANNDAMNPGTAGRCMFRARGNDNAIVNLTLTNSTPQGGTQAEALRVDGLRFISQNADYYSLQDTILVNNSGDQAYFADNLVAGNVDFIWGIGTMYFTNCEIRTIKRNSGNPNGYMCMPRTDAAHNGIAYVRCQLTANDTFPEPQYLARTGGDTFPYGSCAYISCSLGDHIPAVGWHDGGMTVFTSLRFWEYGSTALDGVTPIDTSSRASFAVQLNASQAAAVVDVNNWFGGWLPQLAPYISSQPTNLAVTLGQPAAFAAAGQGVPVPSYQWLKNGSPLANATNATLTIASAGAGDAANYSVIVSNTAGSVTSDIATLTVNVPTTPTIGSLSLSGGQLSFTVSGDAGYLYGIQISTNLVNWLTVFATNATTMPFGWTDPNLVDPQRFYRAVINP
jgi:pectin methylesterase-like acyl-CoA thioesterase